MTDTEIIHNWIEVGESVLLRGPSGIGKTERIKLFSSLKSDNSNKVYTIDANGTDFDRIYNDTIKCINNIIKD